MWGDGIAPSARTTLKIQGAPFSVLGKPGFEAKKQKGVDQMQELDSGLIPGHFDQRYNIQFRGVK